MTLLHTLFLLGIAYLAFCKLTGMSIRTSPVVRWVYSLLLTACVGSVLAPFINEWAYTPHPMVNVAYGAILAAMLSDNLPKQRKR